MLGAIILLALFSCSKEKKNKISISKPEKVKSYFGENSSVLITDISDIIQAWEGFVFFEKGQSKLYYIDNNLSQYIEIPEYGEGPEEYLRIVALGEVDNLVVAYDQGKNTINIYKPDFGLSHSIKLRIFDEEFFSITGYNGNLYYSVNGNFLQLDYSQGITNTFPINSHGYNSEFEKYVRNLSYLVKIDQGFVQISPTEPIIKLYNEELRYISDIDLSSLDILEESLRRSELMKKTTLNSFLDLFADVYAVNNKVYISTYTDYFDKNAEYKRHLNQVIELTFDSSTKGEVSRIIDFSQYDIYLKQIIVTKNGRFFAFDFLSNEIQQFAF